MDENISANLNHKDSVFTKLFSEPEAILGLYNAVSRSKYPPDTPIEITTLKDVFFRGRYNDVSFIIDGKLIIMIEHQSSVNPNMPIRLMVYLSRIYDRLLQKDVYSSRLVKIPHPEFIVLYNGKDDYPDEEILKLSDAFHDLPTGHTPSGSLELTVRVLNVNKGHNPDIVEESAELDGYAILVDKIRANQKSGMNLGDAIIKAVNDCVDKEILAEFLRKYGSEVVNMLNAEFNLDEYGAVQREEGKAEGVLEGLLKAAKSMLHDGDKPEKVARCTGLPLDRVCQLQPQ